jgi:pyridoxine 5-phosphate synthase
LAHRRHFIDMLELGVNIDHVATLRQARRGAEPDPVWAAAAAELGGADCITVHLREDRRHIQDRDVRLLRETVGTKLNLELACHPEIVEFACRTRPEQATLVPERRAEVTTEGGLDLSVEPKRVEQVVRQLQAAGIAVSLFLDPVDEQIERAAQLGATAVELHTGSYALATGRAAEHELSRLAAASEQINALGLRLHAGHGLNYRNVLAIARLPMMRELNIGHAIVSRAVFVGMTAAVAEMKRLLETCERLAERSRPRPID